MQTGEGFWRLTWKEYRTQRSLWLAVLVLTALIQACFAFIAALTHDGPPIPGVGYLVSVFVAVGVYMLGCGATLFALEHEHGTFDFQRLLPVPVWQVYVSKLGVGFLSGIGLLAALLFVAHAFFVGWHSVLAPADWLAGCVTATEVFLWAVLFSLLLRHPLRAAVCGIVAMTVTVCVLLPLTNALPWAEDVLLYHRSFLGTRIGIVALLLAFDTWLTWRWFDGKIGLPRWFAAWTSRAAEGWLIPSGPLPAYIDERPIGWRQLVGITWRQGRWVMLLLCGLFLWGSVHVAATDGMPGFGGRLRSGQSESSALLAALVIISAIVFGLCAFTLDQWSNQFRFYAERGVDPRWLWFSRHVVWFSPVVVQAVVVQWLTHSAQPAHSPIDEFLNRFGLIVFAVIAYALSQLCAMFIHSTLIAMVVSIFAALMGWLWMVLMLAGNLPLWWSVLPMPVVALLATWWFAKDWIEERQDRRHWTQVALVIGAPSLAILTCCALYRAYEIPLVDPGFSVAEYTRPLTAAEQETLRIYDEADRLMAREGSLFLAANQNPQEPAEERERRWSESARPVVPFLERAHERIPVPLTLIKGPSSASGHSAADFLGCANPAGFFLLLRLQAESMTREDKLSQAWRCYEIEFELLSRFRLRAAGVLAQYPDSYETALLESIVRWSTHPQQTNDRIRVALAKLEGLDSQETDDRRQTKIQHVLWTQFIDGTKLDPAWIGLRPGEDSIIRWLNAFMPWEKTRSRRMLNLVTLSMLDPAAANQHLSRWRATHSPQPYWWQDTLVTMPIGRFALGHPHSVIDVQRRAARVRVALADWQREHGKLPEALIDLVGPYFRELPQDPATQRPFHYFPRGIAEDLAINAPASGAGSSGKMPHGTPFLWSPLWTGTEVVQNPDGTYRTHAIGRDLSLVESLEQHGLIWPVPAVAAKE